MTSRSTRESAICCRSKPRESAPNDARFGQIDREPHGTNMKCGIKCRATGRRQSHNFLRSWRCLPPHNADRCWSDTAQGRRDVYPKAESDVKQPCLGSDLQGSVHAVVGLRHISGQPKTRTRKQPLQCFLEWRGAERLPVPAKGNNLVVRCFFKATPTSLPW